MILSCNNISKAFGEDEILRACSFNIEDREKAAIVGINGAGKSTLMKILVGELTPDDGQVVLSKDRTLGYLAQHQSVDTENTIFDELLSTKADILELEAHMRRLELEMNSAEGERLEEAMSLYTRLTHEFEQKNGYAYKSEITGVLKGLGFGEDDFQRQVKTLSGGQKTRVALGRLLLAKPDIILLDEPTNHLDMHSIQWLETFLINYPGSVLIVAHDRYFLDRVVTKVIELDSGKSTVYAGNYTDYSKKRAILRNMQLKEYMNQQREIKHQEEVIAKLKQFNREKSIKRAESREKMLDRIVPLEKPTELNDKMKLRLEPMSESGYDVLDVRGLSKSFEKNTLFNDIDIQVKRGERVALIGDNGTGKTTILKIINGLVDADAGSVTLGARVSIGYYDQEQQVLNPDNTIFDEVAGAYPDLNNTRVRNTLAAFLFTNDDVFKYIRDLSGGERARVSLAKLMLGEANLLILDEPTNHLDMVSREILENALNSYTGTCLYVSHDRYFINTTATRILELTHNTLLNYVGNYDYYEEKHELMLNNYLESAESAKKSTATAPQDNSQTSSGREQWLSSKEAANQRRKKERRLEKLEAEIGETEKKLEIIDTEYANPAIASDTARLMELHQQREELDRHLNGLYEEWESLSEE
jgi:ATP-binding cassette subfamily F protein 3